MYVDVYNMLVQWCAYFSSDFWDGYRSLIREDDGFETRVLLYDMYHQLNHYNLFREKGCLTSAKCDLNNIKYALDSMEREGIGSASLQACLFCMVSHHAAVSYIVFICRCPGVQVSGLSSGKDIDP